MDSPRDLALALHTLAIGLSKVGDYEASRIASEEAVSAFGEVFEKNPIGEGSTYLTLVGGFGNRLIECNRESEAFEVRQIFLQSSENLFQVDSARFASDFACALHDIAVHIARAGDLDGAVKSIEASVRLRRGLLSRDFAKYGPQYANSLENLGNLLFKQEKFKFAADASGEAVRIRARLLKCAFSDDVYAFSRGLHNHAINLVASGNASASREHFVEAISIRKRLAARNILVYGPDLVSSLASFSLYLEIDLPSLLIAKNVCLQLKGRAGMKSTLLLNQVLSELLFRVSQVDDTETLFALVGMLSELGTPIPPRKV